MVSKIIDSTNSTCVTDQRLLFMQPIAHKDSSVPVKANAKLVSNVQMIMRTGMLTHMPCRSTVVYLNNLNFRFR